MYEKEDTHRYDDIMDLPHHVSSRHPRMSLHDRAAQFAPFAALTGYEDAIKEAGRLTENEMLLDENVTMELNRKIRNLAEAGPGTLVRITYFLPDQRKSGGAYITVDGRLKKIDEYEETIILQDEKKIPMQTIAKLEIMK